MSKRPPTESRGSAATGWLQLLVAASVWVFLPLAAGYLRALRGEIKSA